MPSLVIPATLDSLSAVSGYVSAAAAAAGLNGSSAYRLRLAVVELVTNVIEHGYASSVETGTIVLRAEVDETTLRVTIEDTAVPFDPRDAQPPELGLPLEERPVGGLGVYLVLQEVDQFDYEWRQGRNRSIVTMRRPLGAQNG